MWRRDVAIAVRPITRCLLSIAKLPLSNSMICCASVFARHLSPLSDPLDPRRTALDIHAAVAPATPLAIGTYIGAFWLQRRSVTRSPAVGVLAGEVPLVVPDVRAGSRLGGANIGCR